MSQTIYLTESEIKAKMQANIQQTIDKINKRTGMLCGFGDKLDVISQKSKQSGEYYCAKCGEYVLNLQQAVLDIRCDFYFLCYQCQAKENK